MKDEDNTGRAGTHLRAPQAADYLKISESQLSKLRMKVNRGRGPNFAILAGCEVYRRCDLDKWVKSKLSYELTGSVHCS
jgi:hypothetical protein